MCSNDLGFSSIKLAITSIGGYVQMAIEEPRTIVHIVLPASRCTANKEQMRSQEQGSGEVLQPALKEKIPGKVVVQGYRAGSPLSSGTILPITAPQTGGTTKLAVRTRRQRSPQKPTELPPPVCIGIDDSPNLRRVQVRVYCRILAATNVVEECALTTHFKLRSLMSGGDIPHFCQVG